MSVIEQQVLTHAWRATPDAMMAYLSNGPKLLPPNHLQVLGYLFYLQHRGYLPRLSISLPPGSAKTTLTRWKCAWKLEHNPKTRLVYTSYATDLALLSGKAVRQIVNENSDSLRIRIKNDSRAGDYWETTENGFMRSAGMRATITGFRADDVIVDDPHKDLAEGSNELMTSQVWDTYRSVIRTRMVYGSTLSVIQTRWSPHDLIGRLLAIKPKDEKFRWCHIRLPAIAEEDETIETLLGAPTVARLRAQGVPLPAWLWHREEGEPLWPLTFDAEQGIYVPAYDTAELEQIRLEVGSIVWQGLYQQRPPNEGGGMFKASNWRFAEAAPMENLQMIRWWDTAATEAKLTGKKKGDPDWTAGVLMGRDERGLTYILDVTRFRAEPLEMERRLKLTAIHDMQTYGCIRVGFNQDPAAAGKGYAQYLKREVLNQFAVESDLESGDKVQRAYPLSAQQEANNVFLVTGPGTLSRPNEDTPFADKPEWVETLIREASGFPDASHDDQIDAASMAYGRLAGVGRIRARIIV